MKTWKRISCNSGPTFRLTDDVTGPNLSGVLKSHRGVIIDRNLHQDLSTM